MARLGHRNQQGGDSKARPSHDVTGESQSFDELVLYTLACSKPGYHFQFTSAATATLARYTRNQEKSEYTDGHIP
jgi:hypothetical protein